MTRSFMPSGVFVLFVGFACATCLAPSSSSAASQSASTTTQQQDTSSSASTDTKKPKKVWTNDDVGSLNGPVSVVGNSKNLGKPGSDGKADPKYIADVKKQLQKLQSDLDDTNKQLSDLKDFNGGKPASTSSGYPINKGYNRVPVDQQITNLQAKKKQLEEKMDTLLEEARKKGVEPGDLR
jgi:hypothetical protein